MSGPFASGVVRCEACGHRLQSGFHWAGCPLTPMADRRSAGDGLTVAETIDNYNKTRATD